jgi:hypothetical protein
MEPWLLEWSRVHGRVERWWVEKRVYPKVELWVIDSVAMWSVLESWVRHLER